MRAAGSVSSCLSGTEEKVVKYVRLDSGGAGRAEVEASAVSLVFELELEVMMGSCTERCGGVDR